MSCKYPDCNETESLDWCAFEKGPEILCCEEHIEWAFEESKRRSEIIQDFPQENLISIIQTQIGKLQSEGFKIKEIIMHPDTLTKIQDNISRYVPGEKLHEYFYLQYPENINLEDCPSTNIVAKRFLFLKDLPITINPKIKSKFAFGLE